MCKCVETTKWCINQIARPKEYIPMEGVGDCTKCVPDARNKDCKYYKPINVTEFIIQEKEL
jgi:hypothetical protein